METKKYFTHINALRGLAILLVFLYHLREQWCPQGFLGVDAFFVISGYFLIPPSSAEVTKGENSNGGVTSKARPPAFYRRLWP